MFKNIDKVKKNIGETVFNHINSLSKTELEKQLLELKEELKSVNKDGGQRYLKLKDEEFYLLYRLERANEFKYKDGGEVAIDNLNKNTDLRNNMISYIVNSKSTSKMSDKQYDALENKLLQKSFAQLKKEYDTLKSKNQMKNGGGVEWDKDSDSIRTELGEFRVHITPQMQKGYYDVYVSANKKEIGKKYDVYGIANAKDIALEMISNSNKFKNGGGVDINDLNMPVIRTQFEDEEYEFKDGGNVKVGDKVMLPEIKMRDGKIQFEKVENGEVLYIENGIYGVLNPKTKRIHQVSLNQIKYKDGGKIYSSDDRWVVTFQNQDSSEFEKVTVRANNKKSAIASAEDESGLGSDWEYYSAEKQMANGGTTKGFCYTIGGL